MKTIIHYLVAFLSFSLISCGPSAQYKGYAHSNKHLKRIKQERQNTNVDLRIAQKAISRKSKKKDDNPGKLRVKGVSTKGNKSGRNQSSAQNRNVFYPIGVNGK